jgi:hypothetical protein
MRHMIQSVHLGSIAAALGILCFVESAHAFRTAADVPEQAGTARVIWPGQRITYEISLDPPGPVPVQVLQEALASATATWQRVACADVAFESLGTTLSPAAPGDGRNTVSWVTSGWSARGWSSDAAALTDVQYVKTKEGTWQIVEADLYINADDHDWVASGAGGQRTRDLASVTTHEAGHMLGLLHPCELDGRSGAPLCSDHPEARLTTMYPVYSASQATLAMDDIAGVCFLYPRSGCDDGGCTCSDLSCDGGAASPVAVSEPPTDGEPQQPKSELGDRCTKDTACASAHCGKQSYCVRSCASSADCALGATCEQHACEGEGRPIGSLCSDPTQCLGGQCLTGASDAPVCSRNCSAEMALCPDDWDCESVDGQRVCAPRLPMPVAAGGCELVPRRQGSDCEGAGWAWVLFTFQVLAFRLCRNRRGVN